MQTLNARCGLEEFLQTDKRVASPVEAEYMFSEDSFSYAIGANQGAPEQFRNFRMSKMGKKFSNRTTKKKLNNLN